VPIYLYTSIHLVSGSIIQFIPIKCNTMQHSTRFIHPLQSKSTQYNPTQPHPTYPTPNAHSSQQEPKLHRQRPNDLFHPVSVLPNVHIVPALARSAPTQTPAVSRLPLSAPSPRYKSNPTTATSRPRLVLTPSAPAPYSVTIRRRDPSRAPKSTTSVPTHVSSIDRNATQRTAMEVWRRTCIGQRRLRYIDHPIPTYYRTRTTIARRYGDVIQQTSPQSTARDQHSDRPCPANARKPHGGSRILASYRETGKCVVWCSVVCGCHQSPVSLPSFLPRTVHVTKVGYDPIRI